MDALEREVAINRRVLKILDDILAEGDWESNLFLRTSAKRIQSIQHQIETLLHQAEATGDLSPEAKIKSLPADHIEIFVSLFQAGENDLSRWEKLIAALPHNFVNRPIYRLEDHIQQMIRAKTDIKREAYVKVYVPETSLIPAYAGKQIQDRFGHSLLTVKEGAIKLENIVEFFHNNLRYNCIDGRLFSQAVG